MLGKFARGVDGCAAAIQVQVRSNQKLCVMKKVVLERDKASSAMKEVNNMIIVALMLLAPYFGMFDGIAVAVARCVRYKSSKRLNILTLLSSWTPFSHPINLNCACHAAIIVFCRLLALRCCGDGIVGIITFLIIELFVMWRGCRCIVMAYCENGDLTQYIKAARRQGDTHPSHTMTSSSLFTLVLL